MGTPLIYNSDYPKRGVGKLIPTHSRKNLMKKIISIRTPRVL